MVEVASPVRSYSVEYMPLDSLPKAVAAQWTALQTATTSPMQDLEWLSGYFESQRRDILVYCVYDGGQLCGVAAFLFLKWPLRWRLGEFTIASFPLTRLRLLGGTINIPSETSAYDALFSAVAQSASGVHTLFLEEIPVDSFLWKYLHESELIRSLFRLYEPDAPSARPLLRFEGSFEQYMAKFSSKHRKNLNREIKRIRDGVLGAMLFERFERLEEINPFLERAVEVSKKTYQWTLHQQGLSATEKLRARLTFAARNGWMRCYLLTCGGTPCAFVVGFQHSGRFLLHEIGFDPELARYSVGTVLQFMAVQDLFEYHRPEILDLGDYGGYKETLSTESYQQAKVFLFRPGAYGRFIRAGYSCCEWTTRAVASILSRLQLKTTIRQRIRGLHRAK